MPRKKYTDWESAQKRYSPKEAQHTLRETRWSIRSASPGPEWYNVAKMKVESALLVPWNDKVAKLKSEKEYVPWNKTLTNLKNETELVVPWNIIGLQFWCRDCRGCPRSSGACHAAQVAALAWKKNNTREQGTFQQRLFFIRRCKIFGSLPLSMIPVDISVLGFLPG